MTPSYPFAVVTVAPDGQWGEPVTLHHTLRPATEMADRLRVGATIRARRLQQEPLAYAVIAWGQKRHAPMPDRKPEVLYWGGDAGLSLDEEGAT